MIGAGVISAPHLFTPLCSHHMQTDHRHMILPTPLSNALVTVVAIRGGDNKADTAATGPAGALPPSIVHTGTSLSPPQRKQQQQNLPPEQNQNNTMLIGIRFPIPYFLAQAAEEVRYLC